MLALSLAYRQLRRVVVVGFVAAFEWLYEARPPARARGKRRAARGRPRGRAAPPPAKRGRRTRSGSARSISRSAGAGARRRGSSRGSSEGAAGRRPLTRSALRASGGTLEGDAPPRSRSGGRTRGAVTRRSGGRVAADDAGSSSGGEGEGDADARPVRALPDESDAESDGVDPREVRHAFTIAAAVDADGAAAAGAATTRVWLHRLPPFRRDAGDVPESEDAVLSALRTAFPDGCDWSSRAAALVWLRARPFAFCVSLRRCSSTVLLTLCDAAYEVGAGTGEEGGTVA